VSYTLNDMLTLQGRAEWWRDDQGFYAAAFPANFDFTNANRGFANTAFSAGKTTYEELTFGVNIKPPLPASLAHFNGAMIRPEIRYDHADDAKPFNSLKSDHQFTFAADIVIPF
jgi:hypothetical protein